MQAESALAFLRILYGEHAPGHLALWTRQDKKAQWFPAQDLTRPARGAELLARSKDVYFGLGIQRESFGPNSRGTATTVIALPGLWADLDIKGLAHKQEALPPSIGAARAFLKEFPLAPTTVVNSGHGLQAWWLFKELWVFGSEGERQRAQELSRRFQAALQTKARARSWRIDPTADLARLLRLPGTYNHKLSPVPVRVIEQDPTRRYAADEFEPHLVETLATENTPFQPWQGPGGAVAPVLDHCRFLQHCRDDAATLSEPEWWAMVSNLSRLEGGREVIHALSAPYPKYSQAETEQKIEHALAGPGPHTCAYIQQSLGFAGCPPGGCGVKAPAALGVSKRAVHLAEAQKRRQEDEEVARRVLARVRMRRSGAEEVIDGNR